MIKFPLLEPQDIEVKVKQVTKTGALLLLYKTARTDAKILDEVVGPLNWTDEYMEVKGNLYCKVGIREKSGDEFVYKMDCGVESAQDDGQEKKAEASDSFKRACSKLGIGRELYTSPQIWADVATEQKGDKYYLADRYAKYVVTDIKYDEPSRTIIALTICNAKSGVEVFSWELPTNEAMKKKMNKISANKESEDINIEEDDGIVEANQPVASQKAKKAPKSASESISSSSPSNSSSDTKTPLKELILGIGKMVKKMYTAEGGTDTYKKIIKNVTGDDTFKCNTATEEQYDIVLAIYNALVDGGYNE